MAAALSETDITHFLAIAKAVHDRLAKAPDWAGLSAEDQSGALSDALYEPNDIAGELKAAGLTAEAWQAMMDRVLLAYESAKAAAPTSPADLAAAEAEVNARVDMSASEKAAAIMALRQGSAALRQTPSESADAVVIRPYLAQFDALFPDE